MDGWQHAIALTMKQLVATLRFLRPRSTVLLAFDGPAPLAKLMSQRQRRENLSKKWSSEDANLPSPLLATPGTRFMSKIERAMQYLCHSELNTHRGSRLHFYISVIRLQS